MKDGWEIGSLYTLSQVQDYLGTFTVPWVWGGDFNRSPEGLLGKGFAIPAQAHTPKGEWSTCTVGGMIDYFLTPACEQCPVDECSKINTTTIRPHFPVQMRVNRGPHFTQVLGPVAAKKWPDAEPIHNKRTWEEAINKLEQMGW